MSQRNQPRNLSLSPAYESLARSGELAQRVEKAIKMLRTCSLCPRTCRADRLAGEVGFCQTGRYARISSACAHFGEERCLVGCGGSGTIFFTRCNLRCVFCQNADISQLGQGEECLPKQLANLMLELQARGCHNLNFVSPTHVVPQILEALAIAVKHGLRLPIVYNSGGYDTVESLRLLDGIVDIYMPDFKVWSRESGARYLGAGDYAEHARLALTEMHRQVGNLRFTQDGLAARGLLVRHLVMPGLLDESRAIFSFLSEKISPDTYLNIMDQYRPAHRVGIRMQDGVTPAFAEINRYCSDSEISEAYRLARSMGLWRFDQH